MTDPALAVVWLAELDQWSRDIWGHYHSRIIDEFELISEPGGGTSVVVVKWSR